VISETRFLQAAAAGELLKSLEGRVNCFNPKTLIQLISTYGVQQKDNVLK